MKILKFLLVMICALTILQAIYINTSYGDDIFPDSITGKWKGAGNPAVVQIQNKGSYYEGVIVEDSQNPALVSTVIFRNLVYSAVYGVWQGRIYSVKKKKDFDVKIRMKDSDKFTIIVETGRRHRKVEWKRVD